MTFNSEIKSGIALGIVYFLWLLMENFLGFHSNRLDYLPFIFWLYSVIPAVGINWAMKAKRDRYYHGKINFFQALKTGLSISLFMALVSSLMKFIYVFLVNPLYYDTRIAHDRAMIEDLEIATPDKENMISKIMTENTLGYSMMETAVFILFIGVLISFTAATLIKKDIRDEGDKSNRNSLKPEV